MIGAKQVATEIPKMVRGEGDSPLFVEEILAILPDGAQVLDGGCGAGTFNYEKQTRLKIKAVDILTCETVSSSHVERIKSDLQSLPFPENYFDALIYQFVLEHVGDPLKVLDEAERVLGNNGWFYLAIPNPFSLEDRLFRAQDKLRKLIRFKSDKIEHKNKIVLAELLRELYLRGFVLIAFSETAAGFTWLKKKPIKQVLFTGIKLLNKYFGFKSLSAANYICLFKKTGVNGYRKSNLTCPNCGAVLSIGEEISFGSCPYCKEVIEKI